ncbi:MAG: hypothetical protein GY878_30830 [Fuerstiella sp.]|nr:hypothetical protein [Fuerstiella sp.]
MDRRNLFFWLSLGAFALFKAPNIQAQQLPTPVPTGMEWARFEVMKMLPVLPQRLLTDVPLVVQGQMAFFFPVLP